MPREPQIGIGGLSTFPLQEGGQTGLVKAENTMMRRAGVLEPRPGLQIAGSDTTDAVFPAPGGSAYSAILQKTAGWALWSPAGTSNYTSTDIFGGSSVSNGTAIALGTSVYCAMNNGICRFIGSGEPNLLGTEPGAWGTVSYATPLPWALTVSGSATPANPYWLNPASKVVYAVTYMREGPNGVWEEGAPSAYMNVDSDPTNASYVTLQVSYPSIELLSRRSRVLIWRTLTAVGNGSSNDLNFYLVYDSGPFLNPGATTFTYADKVAPAALGRMSYFSTVQEGFGGSKFRPPVTRHLLSNGTRLLADTGANTQGGRGRIVLSSPANTYGAPQWTNYLFSSTCATNTATFTITTMGTTPVGALEAGMYVWGANIPNGTQIVSVDSATQITISAHPTATSGFTLIYCTNAIQLNGAWKSARGYMPVPSNPLGFEHLAYQITVGTTWAAVGATAANISVYGDVRQVIASLIIELQDASTTLTVGTVTRQRSDGLDIQYVNSYPRNQLIYSNDSEPWAWPLGNSVAVGTPDAVIDSIATQEDKITVFQAGGIYQLYGDDPGASNVVQLNAPYYVSFGGACSTQEDVYALSDQGVLRVSNGTVQVISYPVQDLLPTSARLSFAPALRSVMLSASNALWVFCLETQTWHNWSAMLDGNLGTVVTPPVSATYPRLTMWNESAQRVGTRYHTAPVYASTASPQLTPTITGDGQIVSLQRVTSGSAVPRGAGAVTMSGGAESYPIGTLFYHSGSGAYLITTSEGSGTVSVYVISAASWPSGTITPTSIWRPVQSVVRWAPFMLGDAAVQKQFTGVELLFSDHALRNMTLRAQTDLTTSVTALPVAVEDQSIIQGDMYSSAIWDRWGARWVRFGIPQGGLIGTQLYLQMTIACAGAHWALDGIAIEGEMRASMGRRSVK